MDKAKLKAQSERVCGCERRYLDLEKQRNEFYADKFLNTDVQEELGLKKVATEKQKDYYIKSLNEYKNLTRKLNLAKTRFKHEQRMFEIMIKGE